MPKRWFYVGDIGDGKGAYEEYDAPDEKPKSKPVLVRVVTALAKNIFSTGKKEKPDEED